MSSRLETLQVARLAPKQLGDAASAVEEFLRSQLHPDGGGLDRAGNPDLYYTVFALEGLLALQAELPVDVTVPYLQSFGVGEDLDFVHRACLARCWASMPKGVLPAATAREIAAGITGFRSRDGGFHSELEADVGTVYHAFLGLGAMQDLGVECEDRERLAASVLSLQTADGAFANTAGVPAGTTTVTAAAISLLRQLRQPMPAGLGDWLLARLHIEGGFLANPVAPMPDLLSTATALHALATLQHDFSGAREACLDFLDSLWTGQGFCGHWAEDEVDSEYTFYALLALGHLSL